MINYAINRETKTVELLGGSCTEEELKDLLRMFEGYSFTVSMHSVSNSFSPKIDNNVRKEGMVVGCAYVPIISRIEHS